MNKNMGKIYVEEDMGRDAPTTETARVEMHRSLHDSINRLDLVIDALYLLKNRISPEPMDQPDGPSKEKDEPSLYSVLSSSPLTIQSKREHMEQIIHDIEQLLF